jgi:serine/threonine protein kinase
MEIGKSFYQYHIQALLSESNVSKNFLGKHHSLPRNVKIKQIKGNLLETENQKIQLRTIASQNALLQHSHIQLLYDYLENAQGVFFVYEHFEGESLEQFLQKKPSEKTRKNIFIQILDALAYSHRQGIIHLNLHPKNIFVGQYEQVTIQEFGFAIFEQNYTSYASPEQIQNAYTDTRSDIYALGKILAYLFPNPSEHLKKIIEKACQTEAYQRYQTCEAMKADFLQAFFAISHQEETPKTKPLTYIIWTAVLVFGSIGLWFVFKALSSASKQKTKEITFGNNNPMVIKDTIDYNKIAKQKLEEEKEKKEKEKDDRTPEQREKDSLDKIKKEKKEAREKRAKERKEQALKKVIVDGQFVSNNLGEYKINIEIFNSNKDIELQEVVILVSYFNSAGDVIDKEEKTLAKVAANEATAVEVVKKINAARFTCKIKDAKLPPDPNEMEDED